MRVFVTDADLDRLPLYAAAVRARRASGPVIWLATGKPFAEKSLSVLTDGGAQLALLNRAGVDAVVLTPEWLAFGLPRLEKLVSKSAFYLLSANLLGHSGQTLGHPFMVKNYGSSALALTGLALDSTRVLLRMAGVRYVGPDFAASKSLAIMRQRSDFVGLTAEPFSARAPWDADFLVNFGQAGRPALKRSEDLDRLNYYDITVDNGRVTGGSLDLTEVSPDSSTARVLDSVRRTAALVAGRSLALPTGQWTAERLAAMLARSVVAGGLADGFLCDSLFVAGFHEPMNTGELVNLLRDPGRLAVLAVTGDVLSDWPKELVFRPGLSRASLKDFLTYRVATTVDYLQRHPQLAAPGFELTAQPFWTICLEAIESGQAK